MAVTQLFSFSFLPPPLSHFFPAASQTGERGHGVTGWPLPNPHGSPRWRPWRRLKAEGRGVPAGRRLRSSQIDTSNPSRDTRRPPPLPSPAAISVPSISVSCCSSSCSWTAWTHGARWFSSASRCPALAGPCPLPSSARMWTAHRGAPEREAPHEGKGEGGGGDGGGCCA